MLRLVFWASNQLIFCALSPYEHSIDLSTGRSCNVYDYDVYQLMR